LGGGGVGGGVFVYSSLLSSVRFEWRK